LPSLTAEVEFSPVISAIIGYEECNTCLGNDCVNHVHGRVKQRIVVVRRWWRYIDPIECVGTKCGSTFYPNAVVGMVTELVGVVGPAITAITKRDRVPRSFAGIIVRIAEGAIVLGAPNQPIVLALQVDEEFEFGNAEPGI